MPPGRVPPDTDVLGDRLIQLALDFPIRVGRHPQRRLPRPEQRTPVLVHRQPLLGTGHMRSDRGPLHRPTLNEPVVEQTQEPPEPVALARMRSRRQQQHMRCGGCEFDGETVPGDVVGGASNVVGLVDDHHVPTRVHQRPEPGRVVRLDLFRTPPGAATQRLDGIQPANHLIEGPPRIHPGVHWDPLGADTDEVLAETVGHLGHPLKLHALRGDDHRAAGTASGLHLGEDRPGRDGLSQPHLVADRQTDRVHPKGTLQGGQLVGKQSHTSPGGDERLTVGGHSQRPRRRRTPDDLLLRPPPDPQFDHIVGRDTHASLG